VKWMTLLLIPTVIGTGFVFINSDLNGLLLRIESDMDPAASTASQSSANGSRLIFAGGVVEGSDREVALDFEIEGRLVPVVVYEGGRVRKGDVLARLDATVLRHKLAAVTAALALAHAERERLVNGARAETRTVTRIEVARSRIRVEQAETNLRRAMQLGKHNAISQEEVDNYHYNWRLAEAESRANEARLAEIEAPARNDDIKIADVQIRLAEATVLQAEEMLDKATLRAPGNGVILRVTAEPGELIEANRSEPLITMSNTRQMHVRAYVEELDALSLSVGQSAFVVADGGPAERYAGTIVELAPSMGPKRFHHHRPGERFDVKVREILIRLANADALVIGVPVDVFIEPANSAVMSESSKLSNRTHSTGAAPPHAAIPRRAPR